MIYTGATLDILAAHTTGLGAAVEVVVLNLTPAPPYLLEKFALAHREELLSQATAAERSRYAGLEDELVVQLYVASIHDKRDFHTGHFQHTARCTGCDTQAADSIDALRTRRVQLTDNRQLILVALAHAREWASRHAALCAAVPQQTESATSTVERLLRRAPIPAPGRVAALTRRPPYTAGARP